MYGILKCLCRLVFKDHEGMIPQLFCTWQLSDGEDIFQKLRPLQVIAKAYNYSQG